MRSSWDPMWPSWSFCRLLCHLVAMLAQLMVILVAKRTEWAKPIASRAQILVEPRSGLEDCLKQVMYRRRAACAKDDVSMRSRWIFGTKDMTTLRRQCRSRHGHGSNSAYTQTQHAFTNSAEETYSPKRRDRSKGTKWDCPWFMR